MAELARNYHEALQDQNLHDHDKLTSDGLVAEVLGHLKTKLTTTDKADLAKFIKVDKTRQAIKDIPHDKAPGLDGIPHEMWSLLAQ